MLLASRLDQLSGGERRVIERAAIEGTVFHSGAIGALADAGLRGEVDECLASLVRKELIGPYRASFAGVDGFRFRHVLIREAAYDSLPKQIRAEITRATQPGSRRSRATACRSSRRCSATTSSRRTVPARGAEARTSMARAVALRAGTRLASAGRRALAKGDAPAAVNLLDRALALLADQPELRLGPALDLGIALGEAGELARADAVLGEALTEARGRGDRRVELTAVVGRAGIALLSDPERVGSLVGDVEAALPELVEIGDDRALAIGWRIVGQVRGSWIGRFALAEEAYERALVHARAAKTPGRRQTSCASSPSRRSGGRARSPWRWSGARRSSTRRRAIR